MKLIFVIPGNIKNARKGFERLIIDRMRYSTIFSDFEIVELKDIAKKSKLSEEYITLNANTEKNKKIKVINFNKSIVDILVILVRLLCLTPIQTSIYTNTNASRYLRQQGRKAKIVFVTSRSLQLLMPKYFCIDFVDSLFLNFKRKYEHEKNIIKKLLYFYEKHLLKHYEYRLGLQADKTFCVSKIDAEYIHPEVKISPLIIPELALKEQCCAEKVDDSLVFSGNFAYEPNQKAVEWFVSNCWTKLTQMNPDVKLFIVGRNIENLNKYRKTHNIFLQGEVLDMHEELLKYKVAIAPMTMGSGMQYKILEAMRAGLPVVTNRLGLGSISAIDQRDLFLAEDPDNFNDAILDLLDSTKKYDYVQNNAYRLLKTHYSPKSLANAYFNEIVE